MGPIYLFYCLWKNRVIFRIKRNTKCSYRVILSLEAPNYCLCIQSNSVGFSFINTGKQVHLKQARRHFERNLLKDVHHRSAGSRNWLKSYRKGEACGLLSLGPTEGQSVQKYTPHIRTTQRRYTPTFKPSTSTLWEKYSRIWRNAFKCAWMWKETTFSIDYEQVLFCIVPVMCIQIFKSLSQ